MEVGTEVGAAHDRRSPDLPESQSSQVDEPSFVEPLVEAVVLDDAEDVVASGRLAVGCRCGGWSCLDDG